MKSQIPIFNDQNRFGILNFGHCDLFGICDLLFGILIFTSARISYFKISPIRVCSMAPHLR
jgi:hypothetical protein